ncbi:MAG: hypothetical protein ACYDA6_07695 [Solirubrobacteraceae bacterium]
MHSQAPTPTGSRMGAGPRTVAFVGSSAALDVSAPDAPSHGLAWVTVATDPWDGTDAALAALEAIRADVTVVLDPQSLPGAVLHEARGVTLGVLTEGLPQMEDAAMLEACDRIVSFGHALTGERIGDARVWRSTPPAVSDSVFADVRPLEGWPRSLSLGRSTPHREELLMAAKHHHDLFHLVHGVQGSMLRELLREHDVGVYFSREPGGGFGQQAGMHLASGHLLMAGTLRPGHGLERDIDYLNVDSGAAVAHALDQLTRFPGMYQSTRVRGRLKAEQYRASRLFSRIVHDLLADVAAFGADTGPSGAW